MCVSFHTVHAQIPVITYPPNSSTSAKALVICKDTIVRLIAATPAPGDTGTWAIETLNSGAEFLLDTHNTVNNDTIFVKFTKVGTVRFSWTYNDGSAKNTFIKFQAPSKPSAGKDTIICQNILKLYANIPTIGTGKWYSLSNTITFSDPTSPTAIANNLLNGRDTLVWQISNACDVRRDTLVVINQSLPKPNLGVNKNQCIDTVHLVFRGSYSGVWTKLGDLVFSDTAKYLIVDSLKLGATNFVWTISNGVCVQSDTIQVNYSKPKKAFITTPFGYDTTLCVNKFTLIGQNDGGYWKRKGFPLDYIPGKTFKIDSLPIGSSMYYRIFNDSICGSSIDSALLINNTVLKPKLGLDRTICVDFVNLNVANLYPGNWSMPPSSTNIGTSSSLFVASLKVGSTQFAWTERNGQCVASDTINVTYKTPDKAIIVYPKANDTTVCANQINLVGAGGKGAWSRKDSTSSFSNLPAVSAQLKSDTNVFYWTVTDPVCGTAISSVKVINRSVPKASILTDSCIKGIPADFIVLKPKALVGLPNTVKWSYMSSPSITEFTSDGISQSAKFKTTSTGLYKFKYKVLNNVCADSAITTYRILTKAVLPENACYYKKRGDSLDIPIKGSTPNYARGEKGKWTIISKSNNILQLSNDTNPNFVFRALRGVYIFEWAISDGCTSCNTGCTSKDTITITINNRANIVDSIITNPVVCIIDSNYARLKVNRLYSSSGLSEIGSWSSRSSGLVFKNNAQQPNATDTTYNVTHLPIGKDTLYWKVQHVNGCAATLDSVFISRLTAPKAEVKKICYPIDAPNFKDTLTGNKPNLAANETGFWGVDQRLVSDKVGDNLIIKSNPRGIYQARWVISSTSCTGFADTVRIKFITNPKFPLDTFFKVPFSGPRPILKGSVTSFELGRWYDSEKTLISSTNQLVIPDSLSGKHKYTYQIFDPDFGCLLDSSRIVTLITDPKINANLCLKGAQRTSLQSEHNFSTIANEKSIWEADTIMYNVVAAPQINNSNIFNVEFPKNNNIPIAGRLWVKHKVQSGKYILVDSVLLTNLTYLDKVGIVSNTKSCTDTIIVLNPTVNFQKQPYEKAFWISSGGTLKGNSIVDTLRKLAPGNYWAGLVIKDTSSACADTAKIKITKVSKAIAFSTQTLCITDTFVTVSSSNIPNVVESGKWTIVRQNSQAKPIIKDSTSYVGVNITGLGKRSTRLMWRITNNLDNSCSSIDTVNTRIVVGTKPLAFPDDTCIIGQKTINLRGNTKASFEFSKWTTTLDTSRKISNGQSNLVLGVNKFIYTIYDSTRTYKCFHSDTAIVNMVTQAKISDFAPCLSLSKGAIINDTLKVNVPNNTGLFQYFINSKQIGHNPDSLQIIRYDSVGIRKNRWQIVLSNTCKSMDSTTSTVISKAYAGSDTCLTDSDIISHLKANLPIGKEVGIWSVVPATNAILDSSSRSNTKVKLNTKGLTTLRWTINNGSCMDSDSMNINYHTKAIILNQNDSCNIGRNAFSLKGAPLFQGEGAYWLRLGSQDTLKYSSGLAGLSYGTSNYKYTIYDVKNPRCSSSDTFRIFAIKKAFVSQPSACMDLDPLFGGSSININTSGFSKDSKSFWLKTKGFGYLGDTIVSGIPNDSTHQFYYQKVGKRRYIWKTQSNDNAACFDTVGLFVTIYHTSHPGKDTCVISDTLKLNANAIDSIEGETGTWLSSNNVIFSNIHNPNSTVTGYKKGKNNITWEVKNGNCTISNSFTINYISKANPVNAIVCKYYDVNLKETLGVPQNLASTEIGQWISDSVRIVGNIAEKFKPGKNVLKWVITSASDPKCSSDSVVNYYTLTPSGFTTKNIYTCRMDTSITALKPTPSERVSWSASLGLTKRFTTDSSIVLKDLSNDIIDTIIRTISLDTTCPLSDTIKVMNRQLEGLNFANILTDTINTCLNQTFIYLLNPTYDIPTATYNLLTSKVPSGSSANPTLIPDGNSEKLKFLTPQLNRGQYTFTAQAQNANCPVLYTQLNLIKRLDIAGSDRTYIASICDKDTFQLANLGVVLPNVRIDSVRWITPGGAIYSVSDPNSANPDTLLVEGLPYGINSLQYLIYSEGCRATYNIKISNHQKSLIPRIIQGDSVFKCDSNIITLKAVFDNKEEVDTSLFRYYWAKDKLGQILSRDTSLVINKTDINFNKVYRYFFAIKNGVCPAQYDSVLVANFQQINMVSSGTDSTICSTHYILNGIKSPQFAIGNWIDITDSNSNNSVIKDGTKINLRSNTLNKFLWNVANGACQKSDTLELLVGDSIATSNVEKSSVIVCGDSKIQLKADTALNGGDGFWWVKPDVTLSTNYKLDYLLESKSNNDTLLFYYTIKNNYCSTTDSTKVFYFKTPTKANAGEDQSLVKKQTFMNANQPEVGIGTWYLKQGTGTIEDLNSPNTPISDLVFGDNIFIWKISNGPVCTPTEDEVVISFSDFDIPQAFSPNNDGKNDKFEIIGLENYAGSKLKILNRWGREVYSSSDYKNDWSATDLDDDTYFYLLEIPSIEVKHGYVVVKRK